ncbi:MAG: hypothetical protein U5K69_30260 [Balneolaceae bacterium]|nr:hypothetical protein [Balneolaceae bacterium]
MPILVDNGSGRVEGFRSYVLLAKERHSRSRENDTGYPTRAIRTENFLYIRNYKPDRWPAGALGIRGNEGIFADVDDGPTKNYMIEHARDSTVKSLFLLSFGKRPQEELYDLREDPHQMHNVVDYYGYSTVAELFSNILESELKAFEDPRSVGKGEQFDQYPRHRRNPPPFEKVEPPLQIREVLDLTRTENSRF